MGNSSILQTDELCNTLFNHYYNGILLTCMHICATAAIHAGRYLLTFGLAVGQSVSVEHLGIQDQDCNRLCTTVKTTEEGKINVTYVDPGVNIHSRLMFSASEVLILNNRDHDRQTVCHLSRSYLAVIWTNNLVCPGTYFTY